MINSRPAAPIAEFGTFLRRDWRDKSKILLMQVKGTAHAKARNVAFMHGRAEPDDNATGKCGDDPACPGSPGEGLSNAASVRRYCLTLARRSVEPAREVLELAAQF